MTLDEINRQATRVGRAYADRHGDGSLTKESWNVANAEWHRLCRLHGVYGGGPWGNVYRAPPEWPFEPQRLV